MLHHTPVRYAAQERVLVVGLESWQNTGTGTIRHLSMHDPAMVATHLQELDGGVLAVANPDLVLCPLFAPTRAGGGADAVELVQRLQMLGYDGRIAVIAPRLPRADMVQAELRALGPGERLTLIADMV